MLATLNKLIIKFYIIKKIMPSEDPKKVKCVSINKEYPSFEVAFDDMYAMYRVLMCMAMK